MKRFFKSAAAAALLGAASLSAFADITYNYQGQLVAPNGLFGRYSVTSAGPGVYAPIVQAQQSVMTALRTNIRPPLIEALQGINGAQAGSAWATVDGPLVLELKNGVASFRGLTITGGLTVQQKKLGVTVSCAVRVTVNSQTKFNGTLDPYTGIFTPSTIENFSVTPLYSCDTSLDWVPLVNIAVDALVTHYADKAIQSGIQSAYNALGNFSQLDPIHLVGLNSIPDGAFVLNGVDYGPQFKSELANAFYSLDLTLSIGDPKRYITGPTGYAKVATSSDSIVYLNVNGYTFSLWDLRTYKNEVFCPNTRIQPYCYFF